MNEITNLNKIVEEIKFNLNPRNGFSYLMEMVNGDNKPFIGSTSGYRTTHEKIFNLLFPHLTQQSYFGTGKGGVEKYGMKNFSIDFYDEANSRGRKEHR